MPKTVRLLVFLAAGCWPPGGTIPVSAAPKKEVRPVAPAPPPAMPQSLKVARGETLDIQLRIYGGRNEALGYIIKKAPTHGKLSPPRQLNRAVSIVTYEPPDDLGVTDDRFTYSVQSLDGVSAPVEVSITITDAPAKLTVPEALEFTEVLAGSTSEREFELANRGGGAAIGEIKIDAPWKIEGGNKYRLGAGEYRFFKVIFAPEQGGSFRGEMRFSSVREHATALRGLAVAPISAEPAKVDLHHDAEDPVRRGAFEIVNRTPEERTFQLNGGERLRAEKQVTVPANGRISVRVSTDAADVTLLESEMRIEEPGFTLRVPIHGPKVGPIIRVAPAKLSFGRPDASAGAQLPLEVENIGGTIARVSGSIGDPFSLPQPNFELAPAEKKNLIVALQPAAPNRYRAWLQFKLEARQQEVEVEAELIATEGSTTSPSGNGSANARRQTKKDHVSRSTEQPIWMPDMEVAKAVLVKNITPTTATIIWPAHLSSASGFKLERLMLMRDTAGEPRNAWIPLPRVTFSRDGALWNAHLHELIPSQSQTVRVVAEETEPKRARSLFRVDFITPARPKIFPRPSMLQLCMLALLGVSAFLFWRRARSARGTPAGEP